MDRRDPVKWQLVVDTFGRGPLSSQIDSVDGRPGRSRLGAGRSLRLLCPATSSSLSQVKILLFFFLFFFKDRISITQRNNENASNNSVSLNIFCLT